MRFMHSRGFIHRDLKPANILLNADCRTLIADFGTSRLISVDDTPTTDTGTTHYAAPERFKEDKANPTVESDVFSFGLILYEILAGRAVFHCRLTPFAVIRMHNANERPEIPNHVSASMQDLIKRCWSPNPSDRPSFDSIFDYIVSHEYDIVLGADTHTIQTYITGVTDWEKKSEASTSSPGGSGGEE
jgi:serine/threonine protein kinase